jgi:hypothetical protein
MSNTEVLKKTTKARGKKKKSGYFFSLEKNLIFVTGKA